MLNDEPKPFFEHLEDFRTMLLRCITVLLVTTGLSLLFVRQILEFLQHPLVIAAAKQGGDIKQFLFAFGVMDSLSIILKTALMSGLILALPFLFYFIGLFILPALNLKERRLLLPAFAAGGILFLSGTAFCYFLILPQALTYMINLGNWINVRSNWPLDQYLSFVMQFLACVGLSFELPLVIIILAKLNIVNKPLLCRYRKHAFVLFLIFAMVITPSPDPFSMLALAGPMYVLYEISIFFTGWIDRDRQRRQEEESLS
ncbi:MAG: twin-arginine translocase subunit TatC [Methylacidiphilales bacterium]|nr:twin-arginine translocase subunit TatC [Candidatus Methylacidiphilales bacterium]